MDGRKMYERHETKHKLAVYSLLAGIGLLLIGFLWVDSDFILILGGVLAVIGFLFLEFWYG